MIHGMGRWARQFPLNPFNIDAFEQIFVLKLNSSGTYQWNTFYGSGVLLPSMAIWAMA